MKKKYRLFCFLLALAVVVSPLVLQASQTTKKLKETGQKIDELEQKKEDAQNQMDALKAQENGLQGELADLNTQLSDISAQITDLEQQISKKQEEIAVTKEELQTAKQQKAEQYASMKQRIRYIYEVGNANVMEVLLSSTSMADFLNKAEYVEEINRYDREMLDRYENTCVQVAEREQTLQEEKSSLEVMQADMETKKGRVDTLISDTKSSITAKQAQISDAKDAVDAYEDEIAKMKAYEEELEKKKAEEAKKLAEERKKRQQQAENTGGGGTVTANSSDLAMLAALVECEAGGESYEGQWAVASVVVNRVKSGSYPNTVSGVIYQSGQFSPVASGRFAVVLARGANAGCVKAAQTALSGSTNVNALHFCRASSGVPGTVIGNHVFY